MEDRELKSKLWSPVEFCATSAIDWPGRPGQKLTPDETKAYIRFKLAHAFTRTTRPITAYGTTFHPGTVANSYSSMLHQVFDLAHQMKSYNPPKKNPDDPDEIRRDYQLGSIVGVEFPPPPGLAWSVDMEGSPCIVAAAVIHKQAEKVPQVMGEHMGGRHRWTVSLEVKYSMVQSGWIVGDIDRAPRKARDLMAEVTPDEFNKIGMGYVPMEYAPDELIECYDFKRSRVNGTWHGMPVVLMKGGVNGNVHFMGVGMVRYGAEREAEIQQLLATDPDRIEEMAEGDPAASVEMVKAYFSGLQAALGELTR